jgi:hypothetical protein
MYKENGPALGSGVVSLVLFSLVVTEMAGETAIVMHSIGSLKR